MQRNLYSRCRDIGVTRQQSSASHLRGREKRRSDRTSCTRQTSPLETQRHPGLAHLPFHPQISCADPLSANLGCVRVLDDSWFPSWRQDASLKAMIVEALRLPRIWEVKSLTAASFSWEEVSVTSIPTWPSKDRLASSGPPLVPPSSTGGRMGGGLSSNVSCAAVQISDVFPVPGSPITAIRIGGGRDPDPDPLPGGALGDLGLPLSRGMALVVTAKRYIGDEQARQ